MERQKAEEIEAKNIKALAKLHPKLFEMKTFFDDADFLEKYGIFIPQKKKRPRDT